MRLLEPARIASMELKNSVFMAPMGTTTEEDGSFSERSIRYYEERAIGGFGLTSGLARRFWAPFIARRLAGRKYRMGAGFRGRKG